MLSTWYEMAHLSCELNYVFMVRLQKYTGGYSKPQNILEVNTYIKYAYPPT